MPQSSASPFTKIKVLLWKNLILRKRHFVMTTIEILAPFLLVSLIFGYEFLTRYHRYRSTGSSSVGARQALIGKVEDKYIDLIDMFKNGSKIWSENGSAVAYTPRNGTFSSLIISALDEWLRTNKQLQLNLKPFDSESEIEEQVKKQFSKPFQNQDWSQEEIAVAIVFESGFDEVDPADPSSLPNDHVLPYKLRFTNQFPTDKIFPDTLRGNSEVSEYKRSGFLGWQILIDKLIIEKLTLATVNLDQFWAVNMPGFRYRAGSSKQNTDHSRVMDLQRFWVEALPFFLTKWSPTEYSRSPGSGNYQISSNKIDTGKVIATCYTFFIFGAIVLIPAVLIEVVGERETGMKELLRMMGLPNRYHMLCWLINFGVSAAIIATLLTTMFSIPVFKTSSGYFAALHFGNPVLLWFTFFLYYIHTVTFLMFLAAFFERAMFPMIIGFPIALASMMYPQLAISFDLMSLDCILCFFPNVAFLLLLSTIISYEFQEEGIKFENLFILHGKDRNAMATEGIPGVILLLMVCYPLFQVLLALYIENVLPSKFGVRRPWYFIFQRTKAPVVPKHSDDSALPISSDTEIESRENSYLEPEPTSAIVGVGIQKLRKEYGVGKVAVDNVTLNIYRGQITVLLGHNGAGKTTLMSMLTGLTSPTSGTATIDGYNVTTQLGEARQSLGICPQQNMFYKNLTVNEHLVFFAMLKGIKSQQVQGEIDRLLYRLELMDKKHKKSSTLSGGQKRKLNLLMALIGGSQTVILDEPTSGMDPEARRTIWDVLSEMREGRSILLTTHIMEEADFLGDRIAIMSEGKLKCCGSPMFLKRRFGTGYVLHIRLSTPEKRRKQSVLKTVQTHFQQAHFQPSNNAFEVVIALPSLHLHDDGVHLPALFYDIEKRTAELQIVALHLSFTTMDDIFISVAAMDELAEPIIGAAVKGSAVADGMESTLNEPKKGKSSRVNKKGALSNPAVNLSSESTHGIHTVESGAETPGSAMTSGVDLSAQASDVPLHPQKRSGMSLFVGQLIGLILKRILYMIRNKALLLILIILPVGIFILAIKLEHMFAQGQTPYHPHEVELKEESGPFLPSLRLDLSSYRQPDAVVLYAAAASVPPLLPTAYELVASRGTTNVRAVTGNIRTELTSLATSNPDTYPYSYVVAAEFKPNENRAMYSQFAHHALPLSLNMMHNALLLDKLPLKRVRIQVSNHPFSLGKVSGAVFKLTRPASGLAGFLFGGVASIGLLILPAVFVLGPIEERVMQVKQLQLMTGLPAVVYWGSFFIVDLFLVFVISILILICLPIFQTDEIFTGHNAAGMLLLILLLYSFNASAHAYVLGLIPSTGSRGFALVLVLNIFLAGNLSAILLMMFPAGDVVLHVFPYFGVGKILQSFAIIATSNSRCVHVTAADKAAVCSSPFVKTIYKACCDDVIAQCTTRLEPYCDFNVQPCFRVASYFKFLLEGDKCPRKTGLGQDLFCQVLAGILYFAILLCFDMGIFRKLKMWRSNVGPGYAIPGQADSDVVDEAVRTEQLVNPGPFDDAIALIHIRKQFKGLVAVADVTFGVHPGECFGLLGVNGAGKTTAFGIITGDIIPNAGNGYMSPKCSLIHERSEFLGKIGYCPQGNGILGWLTGKEILELFSRLRGGLDPKGSANLWLSKFGLEKSGNVRCENYSGGMKRRLCTAIAMIEDPPIVLLDEPTSGVDPVSRRQFWGILRAVQQGGQSVILTSHSMDECEALCSRLGIMVRGQLQCMGDIGHIKDKFGTGFIYTIKIKQAPSSSVPPSANPSEVNVIDSSFGIDWLMTEIWSKFAPCEMLDRHQTVIQYRVYNVSLTWGQRFEIAEELKKRFSNVIEDYTLNETSLEEVFLSFARPQIQNPNQVPDPPQVESQIASPVEVESEPSQL